MSENPIDYEDPYFSCETFGRTLKDALDEHLVQQQREAAQRSAARKLLSLNVTILQAPSLKPGEIMVDSETYDLLKRLAEYDR
jgi:hypothetical protein